MPEPRKNVIAAMMKTSTAENLMNESAALRRDCGSRRTQRVPTVSSTRTTSRARGSAAELMCTFIVGDGRTGVSLAAFSARLLYEDNGPAPPPPFQSGREKAGDHPQPRYRPGTWLTGVRGH